MLVPLNVQPTIVTVQLVVYKGHSISTIRAAVRGAVELLLDALEYPVSKYSRNFWIG